MMFKLFALQLRPILLAVLIGALLITLLSGVGTTFARAVTITVTTANDDNVVNGNCTLREAIIAANNNTAVDACVAGDTSETITFQVGTVNIDSPLPAIIGLSNITIGDAKTTHFNWTTEPGDVFTINPKAFLTLTRVAFSYVNGGYCVNSAGTLTILSSNYASCVLGINATQGHITIQGSIGGAVKNHNFPVNLNISAITISRGAPRTLLLSSGGRVFLTHSQFSPPAPGTRIRALGA